MKAIMISIKPKWVAKILNGEKTIEVRKNKALANAIQKLIDENGFADIYVYCSKNEYLYRTNKGYIASKKPLTVGKGTDYTFAYSDEGKVPFKFRCYKVEEIKRQGENMFSLYYTDSVNYAKLQLRSCLNLAEIGNYLKGKTGYVIHISDLEIFDKPKELNEFYKVGYLEEEYAIESHIADIEGCDGDVNEDYVDKLYEELDKQYQLTKAPQNFCYVEVEE